MRVHVGPDGATHLSQRALRRAIEARLRSVGLRLAGIQATNRQAVITVEGTGDPAVVHEVAAESLSYAFWIDIGMVDMASQIRVRTPRRSGG